MKPIVIVAALLFATAAQAQYKCTVNGKAVYSDAPCAADARYVGRMEDSVSSERRIQRLEQSIKERRERNEIEHDEHAAMRAGQRAMAEEARAEAAARAAQQRRCNELARNVQRNRGDVAFYSDLGMQRSLTHHETAARRQQESWERECR